MKKDFYTKNAVVVLNDYDTYSGIDGASILFFRIPDKDILESYDGIQSFVDSYDEDEYGVIPKDLIYGHIKIDFLLDFYLKHCDEVVDKADKKNTSKGESHE
jgi:hypothetical protein